MKNKTFYISGMHCKACISLVESEVEEISKVSSVKADLSRKTVEVSGSFGEKDSKEILVEMNKKLASHGYVVSMEPTSETKKWSEFLVAAPIALAVLVLFFLLQKMGILNMLHVQGVTYGTAFLIGIVASFSTCMAVVGGLVMAMSATFSKEGERVRPQILFHAGRVVSFFVFGGVIGALGSAFTLTPFLMFFLSMLVGMVMFLLGVNLLDVFPWAKKWQFSMPKRIAGRALNVARWKYAFTPFLAGGVTFFLPCGFTQSMQLFALTTGNFWQGALTLLAFALGTLPVLLLLSFGSLGIKRSASGIFFKTAGLIVIAFASLNLWSGLAAMGFVAPVS